MHIIDLKDCPEYLEIVANWHQDEWSHYNPGKTVQDRIQEYKSEFLKGGLLPTMLVVVNNGVPLGTAALVECDMEGREHLSPWLASVYVPKEHRKKGIGEKVVKAIMQLVEENNLESFYLYTPESESWYQNMGWKTIEKLNFHGDDVTIMRFNSLNS